MAISLNNQYEPIDRYKAVIQHKTGLLVVAAGPGTGKTFSLLRKIECLLDSKIDPTKIYYLTFVNSIVDAFKSDAAKPKEKGGLGTDPDELGINISTLHSLAFRIVKAYASKLDFPEHVEMLDLSSKPQTILSQNFVNDLFNISKEKKITNAKKEFKQLLDKLTDRWRKNQSPHSTQVKLNRLIEKLCDFYQVCPWDKVVQFAITAIEEFGLPKWLKSAEHYLIDEYQDFNPSEQYLIKQIVAASESVVIVGDPDQSIYSGRSASPNGMSKLLMIEDVFSVNFVHCRRCPSHVINAANALLKHMDESSFDDKKLIPFKKSNGVFEILNFKSCKAELEELKNIILSAFDSGVSQILILFPSRKAIDYYCDKLTESGIKCQVKRTDVKIEWLHALLRLAILGEQAFLERIILNKYNLLEKKFSKHVIALLQEQNHSIVNLLEKEQATKKWNSKTSAEFENYSSTISNLTSFNSKKILDALKLFGVVVSLEKIEELLETDQTLPAKVRVDLIISSEDDQEQPDGQSVQILSIHSSKGLSKEMVIIPAFEDKWMPGNRQGEKLSEMHRLLFVALTRAEEVLIITYPNTRAKGDPLNYKIFGTKQGISQYASIIN